MAKGNGRIKLIGLIITLVILGTGVVANFAVSGKDIEENAEDIIALKTEGCGPSDENEKTIIGIQKDVESTAKTVEEIRTEQKVISKDITYIRAALEK